MRTRLLVVAALMALAVAGCGSDDDQTDNAAGPATTASAPQPAGKAKNHRERMIECIESVGFTVTHKNQSAATATNYTINSPNGTAHAVVILHGTAAQAEKSAAQGRDEDGLNDVAIGRTEFIAHGDDDSRHRVIAECVAAEYDDSG